MPKRMTTEEFIEKARFTHQKKFNYSEVEYINSHTKVKILCKIHGQFLQRPLNHLKGKGCRKCANQGVSLQKRIDDFRSIHGDKYDYSLVDYRGNKSNIVIICPIHGEFKQTPSVHLLGCGCQKCAYENRLEYHQTKPTGWGITNWIALSNKSKYFDSFKVYVIEIKDKGEHFYKIGRTFNTLKRRFMGNKNMPYTYSIIKVFEGSAEEMFNLEWGLKREHKALKYIPNLKFNGSFECFKKNLTRDYK